MGAVLSVGMSAIPQKRLTALGTANGRRLFLEFLCYVENAREVVKAAHAILRPRRRKGEWFACKTEVAIEAVERAVSGIEHEITVDVRWELDRIREATRAALLERKRPPW
jgi:Meiotically Up-regulated Gene 113 (MUG113) protein